MTITIVKKCVFFVISLSILQLQAALHFNAVTVPAKTGSALMLSEVSPSDTNPYEMNQYKEAFKNSFKDYYQTIESKKSAQDSSFYSAFDGKMELFNDVRNDMWMIGAKDSTTHAVVGGLIGHYLGQEFNFTDDTTDESNAPKPLYINYLFVDTSAQNRGVASALLAQLCTQFSQHVIYLIVLARSNVVRGLYEKYDFQLVCDEEHEDGVGSSLAAYFLGDDYNPAEYVAYCKHSANN